MTNSAVLREIEAIVAVLRLDLGTEESWSRLYDLLWPYVLSVTFRELGGVRAEAEEAAQEVFLRLVRYKPFDRLASGEEFLAYVAGMARNAARDLRAGRAVSEDPFPGPAGSSEGASPEQALIDRDSLEKLLRKVSPADRLLLQLVARGESYREVAKVLGMTEDSVAVRFHRLRRRLRGERGPRGEESL